MMKEGYQYTSLQGTGQKSFKAEDLHSVADARKHSPFIDAEGNLLIWVNWYKPNTRNGKKTRPYFRKHPSGKFSSNISKSIDDLNIEISEAVRTNESSIHKLARTMLCQYLNELIIKRENVWWRFKDDRTSSFVFTYITMTN